MRMEINITLDCCYSCEWCNRLLDDHKIKDSEITERQVHDVLDELKRKDIVLRRLKISGGEPTTHSKWRRIVTLFAEAIPHRIRKIVLQSARPKDWIQRQDPLPPGVTWKTSPFREKDHVPFLISPHDLGATGHYGVTQSCKVQKRCGRSFEKYGFTACPVEGTLGRLLGVDPYKDAFKTWGEKEICKHCIYSVSGEMSMAIRRAAKNGEVNHPTPTFKKALESYESGNVYQLTEW